MDIKCNTCGKEVTPLELYNGNWSCPTCRTTLSDFQSDFVVTAANEELFLQSEIIYANWLFNRDGKVSTSMVAQAVELCRRSARMGNPKALARLAFYYDKGYTPKSYGEVMRCKIAYTYYSAICYSGLRAIEVKDGLPAVRWSELCEKTANSMLYMLATAPAELQATKTYSLHNNLERIRSEMGIDIDLAGFDKTDYNVSKTDRVFAILRASLDKQRAPLFGAFRMKVSELKDLYARPMPGKEEKIPEALYWLTTTKKVILAYIKSAQIKESGKMFSRLSTRSSVETVFRDIEDHEYIWVFFFNHNGGHKYLSSSRKRENVEKTIYDGVGTDLLKMMLQNGNRDFYAFYDDDIYQYMKQSNEIEATRALVDRLCNGGDDT